LHTKEIEEEIPNVEDETADSEGEDNMNARFDSDNDEEFDPEYNVQDIQDMNMRS
jgi:hypothetical protein